MNSRRVVSCSVLIALLAAPALADDAARPEAKPIAVTPAGLVWEATPGLPFLTTARVWGARDAAQGRFVKFSQSKMLPLHKHTGSVRVVVVSGTYVYGRQGEPEEKFPPGSYVYTPGGTPHVAGCTEPCVYYEEIDAKPDVFMLTGH